MVYLLDPGCPVSRCFTSNRLLPFLPSELITALPENRHKPRFTCLSILLSIWNHAGSRRSPPRLMGSRKTITVFLVCLPLLERFAWNSTMVWFRYCLQGTSLALVFRQFLYPLCGFFRLVRCSDARISGAFYGNRRLGWLYCNNPPAFFNRALWRYWSFCRALPQPFFLFLHGLFVTILPKKDSQL